MDGYMYWVVARPVVGVFPGSLHTEMPHVIILKNEWLATKSKDDCDKLIHNIMITGLWVNM